MSFKFSLRFPGSWILEHSSDTQKKIVPGFAEELAKRLAAEGMEAKVQHTSLAGCVLLVKTEQETRVIDIIMALAREILGMENPQERIFVGLEKVDDAETPQKKETKPAPPPPPPAPPSPPPMTPSKPAAPPPAKESHLSAQDPFNSASQLIGAEEFKALITEFRSLAGHIKQHKMQEVFLAQRYLFAIDYGYGLTTMLKLMAETLAEVGLINVDSRPVQEVKIESDNGRKNYDQILTKVSVSGGAQHIVCIDISGELSTMRTDLGFRNFLLQLEAKNTQNIIVFSVPFLEKEVFKQVAETLADIMFLRTVQVPPLSLEDLCHCGDLFLQNKGYHAAEDVWPAMELRVQQERSDGRFYGLKTIKKLINEMIYRKMLYNVAQNQDSMEIHADELGDFYAKEDELTSGMEQLESMIGMDQIVSQVKEIIAQIVASRKNKSVDAPCLHMRFLGNPGTGKTTVARIIGRVLAEQGVLRKGFFFEYKGLDFLGEYVGQTAPKTAAICRDAYGSVLFIDEAYALYDSGRYVSTGGSYHREALATLIAEMENHRQDMVVIMAGYTDEMNELLKGNRGLDSRMPYMIEFPNYSREQLYEIFLQMMNKASSLDDGARETAKAFFDKLEDHVLKSRDFGNARFVRNMVERIRAKAALRGNFDEDGRLQVSGDDVELAIHDRSLSLLPKIAENKRIGF